jgi:hypothetical protein
VSDDVSATAAGVVVAAVILELAPLGFDLLFERSVARMRSAATPDEQLAAALAGLIAVVFGAVG